MEVGGFITLNYTSTGPGSIGLASTYKAETGKENGQTHQMEGSKS